MICTVNLVWDEDSNTWFTETSDVPGLHLNSQSFDNLVEKVCSATPEMLEENLDYTGPVHILFQAERVEKRTVVTKESIAV